MDAQAPGTIKQQLVDENADLHLNAVKGFVNLEEISRQGRRYNVVAIIGAQSSGKSTLLNRLFGTSFDMMNSIDLRKQTTKGIWIAAVPKNGVLVLDVEGSDSKERWEERTTYEQSTALFALALTNVLLVNLWTQDVGRFTASNYGVIRVIFEMNIKLFRQETAKRILFVLRDYVSEDENFGSLCDTILNDVRKIWSEIPKPPELADAPPERFFAIDFVSLPHLKFKRKEFEEEVNALRGRFFDDKDERFLFRDFDYSKNLPIDSLPIYMEKVWGEIRSNKDINLPSQKHMVSLFRCGQIKGEVLDLAQGDLRRLRTSVSSGFYDRFREEGKAILDASHKVYDDRAHDYAPQAFEDMKKELDMLLFSELGDLFKLQIEHLKRWLKDSLEKGTKEAADAGITGLMERLKALRGSLHQEIVVKVDSSVLKPEVWNEEGVKRECLELIEESIAKCREKQLAVYIVERRSGVKRAIENRVSSIFEELDDDSFVQLEEAYQRMIEQLSEELTKVLRDSFELEEKDFAKYVFQLRELAFVSLREVLSSKMRDLHSYLIRKFKNLFTKNEKGLLRNWRALKEEEINKFYTIAKEKCVSILNSFKGKKLQKLWESDRASEENPWEIDVLTANEFGEIDIRFQDETENIFVEALRVHASKGAGGIPKWMWALLVFFMYDDVLQWLKSPFLAYPLLIIVFGVALLYLTGLGALPKAFLDLFLSLFSARVSPQLLKYGLK